MTKSISINLSITINLLIYNKTKIKLDLRRKNYYKI